MTEIGDVAVKVSTAKVAGSQREQSVSVSPWGGQDGLLLPHYWH